ATGIASATRSSIERSARTGRSGDTAQEYACTSHGGELSSGSSDASSRRIPYRTSAVRMSAVALALVFAAGCGHARAGRPLSVGPAATLPRSASSHVLVMVMENAELNDVLANPSARYITALLRRSGLATESYAITHPSLPNYLA